ncbi:MAG TPA: MogA/MoaB family molybdenum cofactor biosynthesis protein [Bryobacteraceae bacterium]|nr:MogA/MoaB family molybdenum cofactor biosynthesis protein [Bryobacteraceae bacterium]
MIRVAVVTISDSAYAGEKKDLSGPILGARCEDLGWLLIRTAVVPDVVDQIAQELRHCADDLVSSLILTTGGTGISPRDVTPEATRAVLEREIPGMAELMRARGTEQTKFSVLSRGIAGSRGRTLIVNLPGAPKGASFSLGVIEHLIPHVIDLLAGRTAHSSDKVRE